MSCNKVSVVLCVKKKRASGSMLSFCLIHASLLRMGENFPIDLLWDHYTSLLLCTSMILHTGVSAISIFFNQLLFPCWSQFPINLPQGLLANTWHFACINICGMLSIALTLARLKHWHFAVITALFVLFPFWGSKYISEGI